MQNNNGIRIYGKVTDQMQNPMAHVCVTLLKKVHQRKRSRYQVVEEGWTDASGTYIFSVHSHKEEVYKIIVLGNDES